MALLLAKSGKSGGRSLLDHSRDVYYAFCALFGNRQSPTRLAIAWARFFKLERARLEAFHKTGALSAMMHDIGKANDGFQKAIGGDPGFQTFRHEHISACLLAQEPIYSWINQCGADAAICIAAIGGHHLKFDTLHSGESQLLEQTSDRDCVDILDFTHIITNAADIMSLPVAPIHEDVIRQWHVDEFRQAGNRVARIGKKFMRENRPPISQMFSSSAFDDQRHRLLLAVRSALIAADAAGSGLSRTGKPVTEWLADLFRDELTGRDIDAFVLQPRTHAIQAATGKPFKAMDFQARAATLPKRSLLVAPCGAGKTLAAWYWVKGCLCECPSRNALFLYPTRGTATEGFRDYVSWAPESEAALAHGTASFDLSAMFDDAQDCRAGKDFTIEKRLFALGNWPKRIFSATVDAFLGCMANQYAAMCMLPLLADATIVIDEIHSFSPGMFSALLTFLERFDAPVLCMTASLTASRRQKLVNAGLHCAEAGFEELDTIAARPRYCWRTIAESEAVGIVIQAITDGKRVLWVHNRVDACQKAARHIAEIASPGAVYCYHSRFRLSDRKRRHEEVIRAFRKPERGRGMAVVSTQVCEMSLDLDADLLVSEAAPVPSLIQRAGRCCRVSDPGDRRGLVYIYKGESHYPYAAEEVEEGLSFAQSMSARGESSQTDLAKYLARLDAAPFVENPWAAFWNSSFWVSSHDQEFREGADFAIDCILDSDIDCYCNALRTKDPMADGYIVPAPRSEKPATDPRLPYLRVVLAKRYSPLYGYMRKEK
jgi:CRISPR-associated endonuclease/helicase Cas3